MTLRLHLNENTAGCSPAALAAIRAVDPLDISTYPDYSGITRACERWFGVEPGWLQLTNGLDEGIHVISQNARTGRAIVVEPAFEMYEICATAVGLAIDRVLWAPGEPFPTQAVIDAIRPDTRVLYLTDPNNPTGLAIPPGTIERIAGAAPHVRVLVDEAYADFSGRTLIGPALNRYRNLIIGRTFAKAFGLAALRLGALIAHPATLAPLRALLPPFSLNVCGVRALEAALGDRKWLDWTIAQSTESRALIYAFADEQGLRYWPSEANFVLVRVGAHASTLVAEMAARGILIRDRSRQPGCDGCIRITAGVVDHTRQCLRALEDVLASLAR